MKLRICDLADENPFPDTNLGVHWNVRKYGEELWDEGTLVGVVKPAFGGGYWVEPYWHSENAIKETLDTEEEAKAYLLTIYRMESS